MTLNPLIHLKNQTNPEKEQDQRTRKHTLFQPPKVMKQWQNLIKMHSKFLENNPEVENARNIESWSEFYLEMKIQA